METGKCGGNGDTYQAFRCRLAPADAGGRAFEVLQNAQRGLVKVAACLGQRYGTGGAVHQLGTELIFQGGDLFAHRRLSDTAFFRNGREAPFFDDPDEYLHCIELVHRAPRIPLWNGFYAGTQASKIRLLILGKTHEGALPSPSHAFLPGMSAIPSKCQIPLPEWHIRYPTHRSGTVID